MVRGQRALLLGSLLAVAALMPVGVRADDEAKTLRTDSRSPYVHRLSLYDAGGAVISPKGESSPPYSPAATCGKCHDLGKIRSGWHFNAPDPKAAPGRPGEPWILTDPPTGTQLPISSRAWPGTYRPGDVGLTPWQLTLAFGPFTPGGGMGDQFSEKPEDPKARWKASGRLEIDCQCCHSADPGRDDGAREKQIKAQNLKWAPVAAEGLAIVRGSAKEGASGGDILAEADPAAAERADANVKIIYDARRFDADDRVLFRTNHKPPVERCYFCHSFREAGNGEGWRHDADVHLAHGLTCADCHRNGIDHAMSRGDEGDRHIFPRRPGKMSQSLFSCRSCHQNGRLGAPRPLHRGLPASHLKKLTCTACHAGLLPGPKPRNVQTARAHGLGLASKDRRDDVPPFIVEPVLLRQSDGQIAPHRMMWPAFWGVMKQEKISPLPPSAFSEVHGDKETKAADWKPLTEDQIAKIFSALSGKKRDGEVVYVSAGKVYRKGADGKLVGSEHPAAAPYSWPVAHDVRPASVSLGVHGCRDCHAKKAGFLMGRVAAQSPARIGEPPVTVMYELQGLDPGVVQAMNRTIRYRNISIGISLVAGGLLALALVSFFVSGLGAALRAVFVRKP